MNGIAGGNATGSSVKILLLKGRRGDLVMDIGDRIQGLRKSRGISQEELADKIGVSRQAVSKWESGQNAPDLEKVVLLSDFFETSTDYLLKGVEPVKEAGSKYSALLFSVAGTILNAMGLVVSIAVWIERQVSYAAGIGLIFMLLGTGVFLTGQIIGSGDKERARRGFILFNVWILLLIPLACCFNILDGLAGGFSGRIAPVPSLGNSLLTFMLYWIVYMGVCITVDIVMVKRS